MNEFGTSQDEQQNTEPTFTESPATKKDNTLLKDTLRFALIAVLIVVPFRLFIAQPFIVSGASMVPTFDTGDYLIIDQLSYRIGNPDRGDVVIFKFPEDESKFFIKRVIGLPGEVVEIKDAEITIHEKEGGDTFVLDESYINPENLRSDFLTVVLDTDEYFVLGDNRRASSDSRMWGPVTDELLVGRALLQLFPITNISFLPGKHNFNE